jgi:trimeric autotransporter adhesin
MNASFTVPAIQPSCALKTSGRKLALKLFYIFVIGLGIDCTGILVAQPANEPLEKFVVTDGVVYAVAKNSNTLYFGGAFGQVGVRTGGGVPVSAATGEPESSYPMVNGTVSAVISDGAGGWYIGGSFSEVGGFVRSNLVHIKFDRTVDANWNPSAIGGTVSTLVLTNGILYFGGGFTNVNGQIRNRAAAVDIASGNLTGWDPNVNGLVRRLAISGTNVYIGGEYTTVGGQTRNHLAAVDPATGALNSWNPGTSDSVEALLISNGHLYVGGYFSSVSSQARGCGASFDLSSGNLDPWNPTLTGLGLVIPEIFSMDAWQNTIFICGIFGSAGTSNRVNVAAVDATTGIATSWDAKQAVTVTSGIPSGQVTSLAVYSNALYVGGILLNIGGQTRICAAALDLVTGNATAWDPKANQPATAFSGSGQTIYLGGAFGALGCVTRTNLAAYDLLSNQVTPWDPGVITGSGPAVNALVVASNQVFVGGFFTNVAGAPRHSLAALDPVSGAALPWDPNPPPSTIYCLATWRNRLFVGGTFSSMGGTALTNFAEFDLTTGSVTPWDPAIRTFVETMTVSDNTLYAGGLFSTVGGQSHRRVAAFDLTTDTLLSWNPLITSGSYVDGIAVAGNNVYLGGSFSVVNGFNRTNFVAVDATTAQVLPLVANLDSFVYSVAATSNQVFIGGNFENINGQSRHYVAAVDPNTGTVLNWNPQADLFVKSLSIIDNTLYVQGNFGRLGGTSTRSIGAYPLSLTGAPAIIPNSMQRSTNGNIQFRVTALSAPQAMILVSTDLVTWTPLQSIPLVSGYGIYAETNATAAPNRFYRVSVP